MKNLAMIACVSRDGGLGNHGELLWRFQEDQKFFRDTTMGHPIIMGGKTFASIGRALPGRENIVLSRNMDESNDVRVMRSKTELDQYLQGVDGLKFIVGGASLYEMYLGEAEIIYLTEVDAVKPADTFFPKFNRDEFEQEILSSGQLEDGTKYIIIRYVRKEEDGE